MGFGNHHPPSPDDRGEARSETYPILLSDSDARLLIEAQEQYEEVQAEHRLAMLRSEAMVLEAQLKHRDILKRLGELYHFDWRRPLQLDHATRELRPVQRPPTAT